MPREPKLLTRDQLDRVLRSWDKPLDTLSKNQLVQVIDATRAILRKTSTEAVEQARLLKCDHEGCGEQAIIRKCPEHAGEPPPHQCDECDKPSTTHACPEHAEVSCDDCHEAADTHHCEKHAKVECDECKEEADTHHCEKHAVVKCEHCDKEAEASYCAEHNPANELEKHLNDIIEALAEPADSPAERLWRKHNIERAIENAGHPHRDVHV